ncbi:MAG: hypothetical protein RL020_1955 [Pseudomonadota bacterium]
MDVLERYNQLQQQQRHLRLYALVDGLQYEQANNARIESQHGYNLALFLGTEDEPLAHAGPWLFDLTHNQTDLPDFAQLELTKPAVSWLMTSIDLPGLADLLRLKLHAELPDGNQALLRFYDPRVLVNLYNVMDAAQKTAFFQFIDEWHFSQNGQRLWTGRTDA